MAQQDTNKSRSLNLNLRMGPAWHSGSDSRIRYPTCAKTKCSSLTVELRGQATGRRLKRAYISTNEAAPCPHAVFRALHFFHDSAGLILFGPTPPRETPLTVPHNLGTDRDLPWSPRTVQYDIRYTRFFPRQCVSHATRAARGRRHAQRGKGSACKSWAIQGKLECPGRWTVVR
jgi:hypothetical protein